MTQPAPMASVRQSKSPLALVLVILVCLAPVLASYYFYYISPPEGRSNHGTLILPLLEVQAHPVSIVQRPESESGFLDLLAQRARQAEPGQEVLLQGQAARLGSFQGRWVMVWVGSNPCSQACLDALVEMRQIRLTTGRERDRVERVWLRPARDADEATDPIPDGLAGTWVLGTAVDPRPSWSSRLPQPQQSGASEGLWLIDPQGHLMMHFPPELEPDKVKKDLNRLLKASRVG